MTCCGKSDEIVSSPSTYLLEANLSKTMQDSTYNSLPRGIKLRTQNWNSRSYDTVCVVVKGLSAQFVEESLKFHSFL